MEKELSGDSTEAGVCAKTQKAAGAQDESTQRTAMLSQVPALFLPKRKPGRKGKGVLLYYSPSAVPSLVQDLVQGRTCSMIHRKGQGTCLSWGLQAELGLEPNLGGFQSTPYHTEEMKRGVNCASLFS